MTLLFDSPMFKVADYTKDVNFDFFVKKNLVDAWLTKQEVQPDLKHVILGLLKYEPKQRMGLGELSQSKWLQSMDQTDVMLWHDDMKHKISILDKM